MLLFVIGGIVLRAVGLPAGELVVDTTGESDYYVWPAGSLMIGVLYFGLLSWCEWSGM